MSSKKQLDFMIKEPKPVVIKPYDNKREAVRQALEEAGLASLVSSAPHEGKGLVLIKPNLVNDSPFPITTPVWIVEELVDFLRSVDSSREIVIAEGTGQPDTSTLELFSLHGYTKISGVEFLDLNTEECMEIELPKGRRWKRMFLPRVLFDAFLISVPVLKAHTLAGVTLSMKNMIGVCPPKFYQADTSWRKSAFHTGIHDAIFDLNCARKPDFCLLDATVGLSTSHLSGPRCNPPVNKIVAGYDPVAVDATGTTLLGKKWQEIGHIALADGVLGTALIPPL